MAMNDAFEMVKDKIVWDRETVYEAASRCYMRVAAVAYPLEGSEKPFSGVLVFDTPVSDGCRLGIVFDKEKGLGFLPVNKSELDRFEKERISAVISEREKERDMRREFKFSSSPLKRFYDDSEKLRDKCGSLFRSVSRMIALYPRTHVYGINNSVSPSSSFSRFVHWPGEEWFHGFQGSPQYDRYLKYKLDCINMGLYDGSGQIDGLDEEAILTEQDNCEFLRDKIKGVAPLLEGADVVVFPGDDSDTFGRIVFDRKGKIVDGKLVPSDNFLSFTMYDDGSWSSGSISEEDLCKALVDLDERRTSGSFCRDGHRESLSLRGSWNGLADTVGEILDEAGALGFPVSSRKNFMRIENFATFADKLPGYISTMGERHPVELIVHLDDAKEFEKFNKESNFSSLSHGHADFSLYEADPSKPETKAAYYSDMAKKEYIPFVCSRYEEKADYWNMVAQNREVPEELSVRCAPGHMSTAIDRFVFARHCFENSSKKWLRIQEMKSMERYAREEGKALDLARAEAQRKNALTVNQQEDIKAGRGQHVEKEESFSY